MCLLLEGWSFLNVYFNSIRMKRLKPIVINLIKSKALSIALFLSFGLFLENQVQAQSINNPYCISEFSTFNTKVTEMTVDWKNNYIYFSGDNIFGHLYKVGIDGVETRISTSFVNSADPALLHNWISTDIVYYNDSIFTNSQGNMVVVDLSPTVISKKIYTFPQNIGAEAGMAVIGDKIYTTDGKGSSNAVFEYDIATNTSSVVVTGLPTDTLHGLEYCAATDKLYLAISPLGIYEIDIAGGTYHLVTDPLPSGSRSNFAVDPTGAYAFVHNGTTVHRYDLNTGVGEVFASGLLATNYCDLKFGPSSQDPTLYSLYIGGNDRIYEATGFVPATSADTPTLDATQDVICPLGLQSTTISVSATDHLNGASAWYLYSGRCDGTLVATNTSGVFTVSPSTTTTYFVRGEGECNVSPGGCGSITIIYGDIQAPITSLTHISCNGESNGEIEIFASGGTTPYKYSNDNGNTFQDENIFSGLASGNYNIVVKESNGCINTATVELTEPDPLDLTYTKTDVSCYQGDGGEIEIDASGGVGAGYEYSIDGGTTWQFTNTFSGLIAGTYNIVVRDRVYNYPIIGQKRTAATTTCETDPIEVIIEEPTLISFTSSQTEVSCNAGNDGSITVSATGGTGGGGSGTYQYSIDGGTTWQDSESFTELTAGNYPLSVRDKVTANCVIDGETLIITEPTAIDFTTSQTNINCNGGNEGEIIISATGGEGGAGSASYEYSNDGGDNWQSSNTFSNLIAGDYSLSVRDKVQTACQTVSKTVKILEPSALSFTVEQFNISCNGNDDGVITVTAEGGIGGNGSGTYEYSKDGGATWQEEDTFTSLFAGSYNIRIRDKENTTCNSDITVVSIIQADPLSFTTEQTDVSCNGGSNGTINVTAVGGSGSGYDYSYDNGDSWQAASEFIDLSAGDYTLLIRDQSNTTCISSSKIVRISEPTIITFATSQINVGCFGGDNGELIITANGGVGGAGSGTYQYSIDNGATWQDENSFSGLIADTYDVVVRDAVNTTCVTETSKVEITEPSAIDIETTLSHVSCFEGSNGQIEIIASGGEGGGGTGIFAYSIDGGANWQSINIFNNLSAGTYSVMARDQGNIDCTTEAIDVIVLEPTAISFSVQTFNIACSGTDSGKIIITAEGGVGGAGSATYQYSIDGGYSWQDSDTFEGLFAATYQVLVSDKVNTNCTTEAQEVLIKEADPLSFTSTIREVSCADGDDGQIVFVASGGSGAGYQYSIDGGVSYQKSNTFNNLIAGRYILLVAEADNAGCRSDISRVTITQPSPISFTTDQVDVSCFECDNGVISVSASGGEGGAGTGLYQYSIDNGNTWQDASVFTGLFADTYQVMVRDRINSSCSVGPQEVIITEPTPLAFTTTSSNISCNGNATGEIQITASGGLGGAGSGTYQYTIDDATTWSDFNVFSDLPAAIYQVRVRDKVNIVNVTEAEAVEITEPTLLEFTFAQTDISCNGARDGRIEFTASGGIGGSASGTYSYSINNGRTWQSSNVFESLDIGEYQLAIRDAVVVSCMTEAQITEITEPTFLEFTFTKKDANCSTNDDGEIHFDISGGIGGSASGIFEYTIDNGTTWQESGDFLGLVSGDYTLAVRDKANPNCATASQDLFIDLISPINLLFSFDNISCFGNNDGQIDMSGNGGSGYEYTIDGSTWQDSGLFQNLIAGDYLLMTREKANVLCGSNMADLSLEEPTELSFITTHKNASCEVGNDGEITVEASGAVGGAGSGTYQYSMDDGVSWQDANVFSNLVQDDYLISIRDKENTSCIAPSQTVSINEYSTVGVVIASTDVSCFNGNDGSVVIIASNGVDYEYSIDDGATWASSNTFNNLIAGEYIIVVREQALADCYTEPIVLEIEQPTQIGFTYILKNVSCFEGNDGAIQISAFGGEGGNGTATYEYSIDNGATWQTSNRFLNLLAGSYNLVVRDLGVSSCITEATQVDVSDAAKLEFTVSKINISCFEAANGEITVSASGGASGEYEYSADGGISWQASNVFTGLIAGTYPVSIRDKNNTTCRADAEDVILTEPSLLSFTSSITHADCGTNNNGEIALTATGGSGSYQYSIDNGTTWQDGNTFSALAAATYTAIVRDKANPDCLTASEEIKIKSLSPISYTYTYEDISCPGSADGEIIITVSGAAVYDYSIDNGLTWQASNSFINLSGGTYNLIVRDQATPDCESETKTQELYEAEPLSFDYALRNEACNTDDDGKIEFINVLGGASATYEYSIDGLNWLEDNLFEGLKAGDYSLTIRDKAAPSCISEAKNVSLEKATELGLEVVSTPVSCYGSADGSIDIYLTVGDELAIYEYSIDNGDTWQPGFKFTDLVAGTYNVGIREQGTTDCQPPMQSVEVAEPEEIIIEVNKKDESCDAINDGQIIVVSSGTYIGNSEYTIDGGLTFQTSNTFNGIGIGTYTVFARSLENTNCVSNVISVEITKRSDIFFSASKTNVTCVGANDGEILIGLSIGADLTEYEYSIDDGKTWQEDSKFINLPSGTYAVVIQKKSGTGCISIAQEIVIAEPKEITFTANILNESCGGTNDGEIEINAVGGSTLVYDYSIDNGNTWQNESLFTGLGVGTYDLVVRDRSYNYCLSATSTINVEKDSELLFIVNWLNVQCFGAADGRLRVTMDDSMPDVDYEYSIDAGNNWQSNELFTGLIAGTYDVLVRRAGGAACQTAREVIISQPKLINFSTIVSDLTCNDGSGGSIEVNATGGKTGTYQYSADNGTTWQNEKVFDNLDAGNYILVVRDKSVIDCLSSPQNVMLDAPPALNLAASKLDLSCNLSADGEINASGSGGVGSLSYSIDGGLTYQDNGLFEGLAAGDYTLVLKDENGCELFFKNNPITLTEPQGVTFTKFDINYGACDGGLGYIDLEGTSLYGDVQYSIDGGATYQASGYFGDLSTGVYNIVTKENDGCENPVKENPINLTLASELTVTIQATPEDNICTYYPIELSAVGPDIDTYSWSTGEDTETIAFSTDNPGSYYFKVDVVSIHGCTASGDITLDFGASSPISILATPNDTSCTIDKITLTASAEDAISYLWKPDNIAANSFVVEKEDAGEYMYYIEVTNSTGCISLDSIPLVFEVCIGLNELDTDGVEIGIFPNPSLNGQFTVELTGLQEDVELWVIDFDGRLLMEDKIIYQKAGKLQKQFDLKDNGRGVYFIRIATEDKVSYKRVILM